MIHRSVLHQLPKCQRHNKDDNHVQLSISVLIMVSRNEYLSIENFSNWLGKRMIPNNHQLDAKVVIQPEKGDRWNFDHLTKEQQVDRWTSPGVTTLQLGRPL